MARLIIVLIVLFLIGAFFGFGGVAGMSLEGVAILAAFLILGVLAFLGGTYYRGLAPRPNALSAVASRETSRVPDPATASAASVTFRPDRGDQSLGRAANRYVTFLIVWAIVVLVVGAVLVFGFILPTINTAGGNLRENLRQNREEFREAVKRDPQRERQSNLSPLNNLEPTSVTRTPDRLGTIVTEPSVVRRESSDR
jgi:hypothetical protein